MKTIKYLFVLLLSTLTFSSCSSDDDNPTPVNEEEIITTVRVELTAVGGGSTVVLQSQDLDGDGPDAPVITTEGTIVASTTYSGSIQFLNELDTPAEDITLEVLEEDDEHQVFYEFTGNSNSTIAYNDSDPNGNPIGVIFSFNSGSESANNTITVTLRHEPNKDAAGVSDGLIANAGGETDVAVTFTFDVVTL